MRSGRNARRCLRFRGVWAGVAVCPRAGGARRGCGGAVGRGSGGLDRGDPRWWGDLDGGEDLRGQRARGGGLLDGSVGARWIAESRFKVFRGKRRERVSREYGPSPAREYRGIHLAGDGCQMVTRDTGTSLKRPRGRELSQVAVTTRHPSPHEGENSTVRPRHLGQALRRGRRRAGPPVPPNLEHPSGAVR